MLLFGRERANEHCVTEYIYKKCLHKCIHTQRLKDLRQIADFRNSHCTAIPKHHQRILTNMWCTPRSTFSVFQYVLHLTSGSFPRYFDSVKLRKICVIAEIHRRCYVQNFEPARNFLAASENEVRTSLV